MRFFLCIIGAVLLAVVPLVVVSIQAVKPLTTCKAEAARFQQVYSEGRSYTPSEIAKAQQIFTLCIQAFQSWDNVASIYIQIPFVDQLGNRFFPTYMSMLRDARTYSPYLAQLIRLYPSLIGVEGEKRYLLLLQNNTELRPTGGFIGSFIYIVFKDGKLAEFRPEDIYIPDGQLKGYVKPPEPVETYLYQKGGWKLRDANWDPDFPQAVQTLLWFFEKGGYTNIDGVATITLSAVQDYLKILGPLYLPDYDKNIDAEGLYSFAQSQTEQGFFPGASNKRDVLGALTRAMTRSIHALTSEKYQELARLFFKHMRSKDIMMWAINAEVQEFIQLHQWDGALHLPSCKTQKCRTDYLYIVEANVGINKANCCIDRKVLYEVWLNADTTATSSVRLEYKNNNPITPQPPKYYGGGYNNFLRLLRDPSWELIEVLRDEKPVDMKTIVGEVDDISRATSSGMLADVGGGETHSFTYTYLHAKRMDYTQPQEYMLVIQKQPGLITNEYEIQFHVPSNTSMKGIDSPVYYEYDNNILRIHTEVTRDLLISFTVQP